MPSFLLCYSEMGYMILSPLPHYLLVYGRNHRCIDYQPGNRVLLDSGEHEYLPCYCKSLLQLQGHLVRVSHAGKTTVSYYFPCEMIVPWNLGMRKLLTYDHEAPIVRVARRQPQLKFDGVVVMTIFNRTSNLTIGNIVQGGAEHCIFCSGYTGSRYYWFKMP